ncbi:Uncharacterised protein [Klebsiella pneumoniae subsp. ozaenae]|uniref:Uncharacterized protein n=1 Tax=Klebsiella pneumoniae subsp. ozaenae TaxID=574 RepID=A0A378BQZ3_KLEPO|nr:Uncharacterised protein [Klebsiella pneumoniae subsp. ozaenae]
MVGGTEVMTLRNHTEIQRVGRGMGMRRAMFTADGHKANELLLIA